jgi:hypothetical protein
LRIGPLLQRFGETFEVAGRAVILRLWANELRDPPVELPTSPDGATIAVVNLPSVWQLEFSEAKNWQRAVLLLDRATLGRPRILVDEWGLRALAFGPNSDVVATVGGFDGNREIPPFDENRVVVFRVSDGARVRDVRFTDGFAERVAFDDEGVLYVESDKGLVRAYRDGSEGVESTIDSVLRARLDRSATDAKLRRASSAGAVVAVSAPQTSAVNVVDGERQRAAFPEYGLGHRLVMSPDGRRLVASGSYSVLWDVATGERLATLPPVFVDFDPESRVHIRRVVRSERRHFLVRLDDEVVLRELPSGDIEHVSADGRRGLARRVPDVDWCDFEQGVVLAKWAGDRSSYASALALSPRQDVAVIHGGGYRTSPSTLWTMATDTRVALDLGNVDYDHARYAFDASGQRLFVAACRAPDFERTPPALVVACVDVATGKPDFCVAVPAETHELQERALVLDPRGRFLVVSYVARSRAHILVLRAGDGEVLSRFEDLKEAAALALSPDGSRLYVAHDAECISCFAISES